jgi:hypothetical protein
MSEQLRESAEADRMGGVGRSAEQRSEAGIPPSREQETKAEPTEGNAQLKSTRSNGPSGPARQRQERKQ